MSNIPNIKKFTVNYIFKEEDPYTNPPGPGFSNLTRIRGYSVEFSYKYIPNIDNEGKYTTLLTDNLVRKKIKLIILDTEGMGEKLIAIEPNVLANKILEEIKDDDSWDNSQTSNEWWFLKMPNLHTYDSEKGNNRYSQPSVPEIKEKLAIYIQQWIRAVINEPNIPVHSYVKELAEILGLGYIGDIDINALSNSKNIGNKSLNPKTLFKKVKLLKKNNKNTNNKSNEKARDKTYYQFKDSKLIDFIDTHLYRGDRDQNTMEFRLLEILIIPLFSFFLSKTLCDTEINELIYYFTENRDITSIIKISRLENFLKMCIDNQNHDFQLFQLEKKDSPEAKYNYSMNKLFCKLYQIIFFGQFSGHNNYDIHKVLDFKNIMSRKFITNKDDQTQTQTSNNIKEVFSDFSYGIPIVKFIKDDITGNKLELHIYSLSKLNPDEDHFGMQLLFLEYYLIQKYSDDIQKSFLNLIKILQLNMGDYPLDSYKLGELAAYIYMLFMIGSYKKDTDNTYELSIKGTILKIKTDNGVKINNVWKEIDNLNFNSDDFIIHNSWDIASTNVLPAFDFIKIMINTLNELLGESKIRISLKNIKSIFSDMDAAGSLSDSRGLAGYNIKFGEKIYFHINTTNDTWANIKVLSDNNLACPIYPLSNITNNGVLTKSIITVNDISYFTKKGFINKKMLDSNIDIKITLTLEELFSLFNYKIFFKPGGNELNPKYEKIFYKLLRLFMYHKIQKREEGDLSSDDLMKIKTKNNESPKLKEKIKLENFDDDTLKLNQKIELKYNKTNPHPDFDIDLTPIYNDYDTIVNDLIKDKIQNQQFSNRKEFNNYLLNFILLTLTGKNRNDTKKSFNNLKNKPKFRNVFTRILTYLIPDTYTSTSTDYSNSSKHFIEDNLDFFHLFCSKPDNKKKKEIEGIINTYKNNTLATGGNPSDINGYEIQKGGSDLNDFIDNILFHIKIKLINKLFNGYSTESKFLFYVLMDKYLQLLFEEIKKSELGINIYELFYTDESTKSKMEEKETDESTEISNMVEELNNLTYEKIIYVIYNEKEDEKGYFELFSEIKKIWEDYDLYTNDENDIYIYLDYILGFPIYRNSTYNIYDHIYKKKKDLDNDLYITDNNELNNILIEKENKLISDLLLKIHNLLFLKDSDIFFIYLRLVLYEYFNKGTFKGILDINDYLKSLFINNSKITIQEIKDILDLMINMKDYRKEEEVYKKSESDEKGKKDEIEQIRLASVAIYKNIELEYKKMEELSKATKYDDYYQFVLKDDRIKSILPLIPLITAKNNNYLFYICLPIYLIDEMISTILSLLYKDLLEIGIDLKIGGDFKSRFKNYTNKELQKYIYYYDIYDIPKLYEYITIGHKKYSLYYILDKSLYTIQKNNNIYIEDKENFLNEIEIQYDNNIPEDKEPVLKYDVDESYPEPVEPVQLVEAEVTPSFVIRELSNLYEQQDKKIGIDVRKEQEEMSGHKQEEVLKQKEGIEQTTSAPEKKRRTGLSTPITGESYYSNEEWEEINNRFKASSSEDYNLRPSLDDILNNRVNPINKRRISAPVKPVKGGKKTNRKNNNKKKYSKKKINKNKINMNKYKIKSPNKLKKKYTKNKLIKNKKKRSKRI